jgi:hypothetical protein
LRIIARLSLEARRPIETLHYPKASPCGPETPESPGARNHRRSAMGELYQKMSQDLAIKNLAAGTRAQYLRCCFEFARYHMRSPREMGLAEIKDYLGRMVCQGASPEKLKMHVAGLKFLYGTTLDREEIAKKIPWPVRPGKAGPEGGSDAVNF